MLGIFFTYIFGVIFIILASIRFIHMLQLESYQNGMFSKWIAANCLKGKLAAINAVCLLCSITTAVLFYGFGFYNMSTISGVVCGVIAGYSFFDYYKSPKKKPLVITERVKRLVISLFVVLAVLLFLFSYVIDCLFVVVFVFIVISPYLLIVANVAVSPVEKLIKRSYLNEAKSILKDRDDLIKIGITGSFGKTSTKFILNTILSEKYNSLCSPASYNTPMGLTRVIREMLKDEHEVLIAEMGARYTGDIKELCDLVHPKYGLISSIGKQHLETFKTLDNIIQTKYDLIRSLPKDGIGYLPDDKDICTKLFRKKDGHNKKLYSLKKNKDAYVYADNIVVNEKGSSFDICTETHGTINATTCLLGEHNVQNILGCVAVALDLGLSLEQIKAGIEKIKPIEHRLQIIDSPTGVIIIDDAFNANPTGTKMALKVLSEFKGKKIIVTPGLVELGEETGELNKQFGSDIAEVCDVVVLVGNTFSRYIKSGLLDNGFDEGAIVEYDSLDEVSNFIGAYAKPGDVVLFENDLTDNYL